MYLRFRENRTGALNPVKEHRKDAARLAENHLKNGNVGGCNNIHEESIVE
jgi:hypothetical protein